MPKAQSSLVTKSRSNRLGLEQTLPQVEVQRGLVHTIPSMSIHFQTRKLINLVKQILNVKMNHHFCPALAGHILKLERYRED